jgi:putative transposase
MRLIASAVPTEVFNKAVHLRTVAICVLPDHLHALWALPDGDADFSTRWSLIKSAFSRGFDPTQSRSSSKVAKREKGIWQRRYWEHAIRDDADLERHVDYIHFNPVKHGYVTRVSDWPHSSFHRYVEARSGLGRRHARYQGIVRRMNGGHGAKSAFAHPTVWRQPAISDEAAARDYFSFAD